MLVLVAEVAGEREHGKGGCPGYQNREPVAARLNLVNDAGRRWLSLLRSHDWRGCRCGGNNSLRLRSDAGHEAVARSHGHRLLVNAQREQGEVAGDLCELAGTLRALLHMQRCGGGLAGRERLDGVEDQV